MDHMQDTNPRAFVFVLMPFHESFGDIYEAGIKPACRDAGAYCERVDEQIFVESILERLYNQISKADIIIAEMTGRNPNVFYEVGYAHALNKQVILLTQNSEDIPFDLKHYPHIVYGGKIAALKSQLEARVRWCIENPKQPLVKVDWSLEFFLNGIPLKENPCLTVKAETLSFGAIVNFDIGLHNPMDRMISGDTFDLAIIAPPTVKRVGNARSTSRLPNGGTVCNLPKLSSIFPAGWDNLSLELSFANSNLPDKPVELILRLFKEVGTEDHPFSVFVSEFEKRT